MLSVALILGGILGGLTNGTMILLVRLIFHDGRYVQVRTSTLS